MKSDLAASVVFLGISIVALFGAWDLGIGTVSAPEAGMYPFLLAVGGAILSILLAVNTLRHRSDLVSIPSGRVGATLVVIVALGAFVALIPVISFTVSAVLLMAVLFLVGKMRSLPRLITLSLLLGVGADITCRLIGIPLPDNLLSQLLTGA